MALPLGDCTPFASSCTIPQLVAFPTSLAALKHPILWNASCWITDRRLDEFELLTISRYAFPSQSRTPHIEWCQFASDSDSEVSLLIIFPNLATSFRSAEVMEKWTDRIVLPAFSKHGLSAGTLSKKFKIIRMTADAEREETLNLNAPDTPLCGKLSKPGGVNPEDLDAVWKSIVETANSSAFSEFNRLSLVALCHPRRSTSLSLQTSLEESWKAISDVWDRAVNMEFIPVEHIRAYGSVSIAARPLTDQQPHSGSSHRQSTSGGEVPGWIQSGSSFAPDTSRKRKTGDLDDMSKRSRFQQSDESDHGEGVPSTTGDTVEMDLS